MVTATRTRQLRGCFAGSHICVVPGSHVLPIWAVLLACPLILAGFALAEAAVGTPVPSVMRGMADNQYGSGDGNFYTAGSLDLLVVAARSQDPAAPASSGVASSVAAAPAKPVTPEKKLIRLFGTVEFRGLLKDMPKWQRVLEAEEKSPTFDGDLSGHMRASVYKQWLQLVERVKNKPDLEKAKSVTAFFNRWPYRLDEEVYKLADYWATPAEFMKNSGDCEDYAIVKFYALMKLGVSPENMRIVALKDNIRNIGHAILALYTNDDAYVLDNLTDLTLTHARFQHYAPQYSVNAVYRWAHVRPKKK